jgi:type VI secretion system secreted protein VgrG
LEVPYGLGNLGGTAPHEEYFILVDVQTGEPLPEYPYTIQHDGVTLRGRTDAQGQTQIVKTSGSKLLLAEAEPDPVELWLLDARYWEQDSDGFQIDFLRNPEAEKE